MSTKLTVVVGDGDIYETQISKLAHPRHKGARVTNSGLLVGVARVC